MTKSVNHAWEERMASPEHVQDHHNLVRNSHPHALEALEHAFRAGWHARPQPAAAPTAPAPKKGAHK